MKALHGDMTGAFRLRVGAYRVLFSLEGDVIRIFGVRHRSDAYREVSPSIFMPTPSRACVPDEPIFTYAPVVAIGGRTANVSFAGLVSTRPPQR